jgi:cell division protein FtsB
MNQQRCVYCGLIFAACVLSALGYLSFTALQGDYGLHRYIQVQADEERLRADLAALQSERAALSNKVRRLTSATLDGDLLDERARVVLGLTRPDELVLN